jgi:hypothetical protein
MGKIERSLFGQTDSGEQVEQFTLTNKNGTKVEVSKDLYMY